MDSLKTGVFSNQCSKCYRSLKQKEPVYCGICFIEKIWEIEKLEKLKKAIEEIIEMSELDKKKLRYSKTDYEDLF